MGRFLSSSTTLYLPLLIILLGCIAPAAARQCSYSCLSGCCDRYGYCASTRASCSTSYNCAYCSINGSCGTYSECNEAGSYVWTYIVLSLLIIGCVLVIAINHKKRRRNNLRMQQAALLNMQNQNQSNNQVNAGGVTTIAYIPTTPAYNPMYNPNPNFAYGYPAGTDQSGMPVNYNNAQAAAQPSAYVAPTGQPYNANNQFQYTIPHNDAQTQQQQQFPMGQPVYNNMPPIYEASIPQGQAVAQGQPAQNQLQNPMSQGMTSKNHYGIN